MQEAHAGMHWAPEPFTASSPPRGVTKLVSRATFTKSFRQGRAAAPMGRFAT